VPIDGQSLMRPAVVKRFLHLFCLFESFLVAIGHTPTCAQENPFAGQTFFRCRSLFRAHATRSARVTSSLQCCPPTISSIIVDHDELFDLPAIQDSGRRSASFGPSAVRVNTETVYSGRREAGLVMTSPFHNPVREGLPTTHQLMILLAAYPTPNAAESAVGLYR
jgi:hypothetical protein